MYLKNSKLIIAFFCFFCLSSNSFADEAEEAKFFADFIYEIPSLAQGINKGDVCSFGYDTVVAEMQLKSDIVNIDTYPQKYISCKLIYIARDKEKIYKSYVAKFNHKRILTVSLLESFNENGGMILVQMGRRSFELTINSKEIKEAGIRLDPLLLELVINN